MLDIQEVRDLGGGAASSGSAVLVSSECREERQGVVVLDAEHVRRDAARVGH